MPGIQPQITRWVKKQEKITQMKRKSINKQTQEWHR